MQRITPLINQNINLQTDLTATGNEVFNISIKGLEPIITAGNKISIELEKFEQGFKNWNKKFDNFSTLFDTWDFGFQALENKIVQLENQIITFSGHHTNIINNLEKVLNQIDLNLDQWKKELVRINDNSQQIEDNNRITIETFKKTIEKDLFKINNSIEQVRISLINLPSSATTSSSTSIIYSKQRYKTLPSNNHNFEFKNVNIS